MPSDSANAAFFLLNPNSNWITGQILAVDGGMGSLRTM
jgi:NAD(P)-dependent dehydrogenase (short-subunit alcohol dehydrogenase family)